MQTQIYQKETNRNILKLLGQSLRDFKASSFLAFQLAKRDITAQYWQSFLGVLWAFILPIATAFVWMFLNFSGFKTRI
jgi:lipopolysaccharide transport system permease protein